MVCLTTASPLNRLSVAMLAALYASGTFTLANGEQVIISTQPPQHLGIGLLQGPRGGLFLMSEVPL